MSHLDEGTLHALLDGEIPSQELGAIQAHLAGCASCRARLDEERQLTSEAMGLVELVELPEPVGAARGPASIAIYRVPWVRGLAWAASVIGAVGLGYAARGTTAPIQIDAARSVEPIATGTTTTTAPTAAASGAAEPKEIRPTHAAPKGQSKVAANRARALDAATPERDEARSDAAKPAPPASQPAAGIAAAEQTRQSFAQLKVMADSAEPVSFPEALRRLNGSMYLIPGMIPVGLEARGALVSVIYPGHVTLWQELVDGTVVFRLVAPPGFPPDSLERLRMRVRE